MAELQPLLGQINDGGALVVVTSTENSGGTKRQRRPSVRLGDIGGDHQSYDSPINPPRRSNNNHWKQQLIPSNKKHKSFKTRTSINLSGRDEDKEGNLDSVAVGSWKFKDFSKSNRSSISDTKRIRSNWASKMDDVEVEKKFGCEEEDVDDGGFRDFDSDSLDSPVHSLDDNERERGNYRRARVLEGAIELVGPSDTDDRNWNKNSNVGRNGVRVWLNQLGLGRYAPVFEIHEVDDEVLPTLTLEDLKDMGITAVGSRRKMYASIQKLGKGFS